MEEIVLLDTVTSASTVQFSVGHGKAFNIFVEVYMLWNPGPSFQQIILFTGHMLVA